MSNSVPGSENRWRWLLPSLLVSLGFLPLIYWHVAGLLERPHYQFIVLLPVAWWLLAGEKLTNAPPASTRGAYLLGLALLVCAASGLGFASWVWSPWVGGVSALLAGLGLMLMLTGWAGATRWMPVWIVSWILIPLPFGLDETVIVKLRTITTRYSSLVLDQIGVLHQSYANVIELPGKPLFIADACSGIHSLYVLLGIGLFVSAWNRRSVIHAILLLLSTFGFVLVENIVRIVTVAFAWTKGKDFTDGNPHMLLGALLFCLSAAIVFSADQLLLFLLPERPFAGLLRLFEKKNRRSVVKPVERAVPAANWFSTATILASAIFPIFGLFQLTQIPASPPRILAMFDTELKLPDLGEETLPKEVSGFTRSSFSMIDRVDGDPFGRSSQQWVFQKDNLTVSVYLDYPFDSMHDLCQCYGQIGWNVMDSNRSSDAFDTPASQTESPAVIAGLNREFYGNSLIYFSQFDLNGRIDTRLRELPPDEAKKGAAKRLDSLKATQPSEPSSPKLTVPLLQVQMFVAGFPEGEPVDDLVRKELLEIYFSFRRTLIQRVIETQRTGEPG